MSLKAIAPEPFFSIAAEDLKRNLEDIWMSSGSHQCNEVSLTGHKCEALHEPADFGFVGDGKKDGGGGGLVAHETQHHTNRPCSCGLQLGSFRDSFSVQAVNQYSLNCCDRSRLEMDLGPGWS